jgi:pimeloyl-ACP methyl ester carboxylesterase
LPCLGHPRIHDPVRGVYLVFRWDDRGVGKSDGDYLSASAEHIVGDVINAMSAIERETGFDQHTLTGHSQGTLIASAVAANRPSSVAGLVLLAGMGLPGRESLLDQHVRICQAEGKSDDDIRPSLTQKKALFDILLDTQAEIDAGMPAAQALQCLRATLLGVFLRDIKISDISENDRDELGCVIEGLLA